MRVQIPAYTDRWMMGDRYGEVVKIKKTLIKRQDYNIHYVEIATVLLDKSGKKLRFRFEDCTEV